MYMLKNSFLRAFNRESCGSRKQILLKRQRNCWGKHWEVSKNPPMLLWLRVVTEIPMILWGEGNLTKYLQWQSQQSHATFELFPKQSEDI